ncbi:hypothetical protein ACSBR1_015947 [Camellia fascicularis]
MLVAASAIYFLNLHSDVLINRLYCDDVGWYKEKKEEVAEMEVDPERDQRMVNEAGQNESTFKLILISIIFSLPPEVSCFLGYSLWGYNMLMQLLCSFIEFFDAMSLPMAIALSGQPLLG